MPQRAYIFHQDANEGKVDQLRAFARRWRQSAEYVKEIQWRLFFETGSFDKHTPVSRYRDDIKDRIGGSAKIQAVSHQVVSVLKSWVSNRKQDFTRIVERSSLSEEIRHQLHVINLTESWFDPEPIEMEETGDVIDDRVRKLARIIFKRCMDEHRRPNLSNIHPILDQRMVSIETSHSASRYRKWLKVSTHQFRETVYIPLKHNPYFKSQPGEVSNSVQMVCRDDNIEFRLFRNPDFSDQRQFYNPDTEVIGLDFGLTPLLATNEGDLLSREFKDRLEDFDERITKLARYRQEHGLDVSSQRYKRLIESLRGYIKSEINRVFNRLIESKKPSHLVVEDLNLQHPDLSRSLNRLISFCGRSEIQEKLDKLEEEYGITYEEVPSPYSSVACSSCKYPDPSNRNEDRFECRFCGLECHADVNAARNLVSRRSWDDKVSEPLTKRGILHRQLRLHVERQTKTLFQGVSSGSGINGDAADLLLENRYIDDSLKEEVISKWNDHASVVSELASST